MKHKRSNWSFDDLFLQVIYVHEAVVDITS